MGIIRSQSIKSSLITYIGFAIGGIYTVMVAKLVDPNIAGLTRFFISVGTIVFALSNLGSVTMMNKFYPYYRDMLPAPKRDVFGIVLSLSTIGFILCCLGSWIMKDLVIQKYGAKSIYVVEYYYMLMPFSIFYLFFVIFENFSYNQYKSIYPIFLKEVGLRILNTVFAVLLITGLFTMQQYFWSYTFIYGILLALLVIYLYRQRDLIFTFHISRVTRKLAHKMISFNGLIWSSAVLGVIAQNIDNLSISSDKGLDIGFVYEFATYISTVILVPQRSIIAIAIPVLAQAWKDRDLSAIQSIYTRSSNTMFTYALMIFLLIWLNVHALFGILDMKSIFYEGIPVIFYLGLMQVIDMGFGINSQIVGTSNHWRFEFVSNLVKFIIAIPLNVAFLKMFGIQGNALANLLSITAFNLVRYLFIWYKFGLQPFNRNTLYILLTGVAGYGICYLIEIQNPYVSMLVRGSVFSVFFLGIVLYFKLSKDVVEGYNMIVARLRKQ